MRSDIAEDAIEAKVTYQEAAQLLRHYSTMRGSLVSFLLTVSLGLGGWAMSNRGSVVLVYYLMSCEFMVYLLAVIVCVYFSANVNKARKLLLRMEAGERLRLFHALDVSRFVADVRLDIFDWLIVISGSVLHLSLLAYNVYFAR